MAYIDEYRTEFSEDRKKVLKFTSEISDYSIPEGTEEIATNAFKGNKTLKVLHLPSTIKFIREGALEECKIEEIHFAGDLEQWLQITWDSVFSQGYRLYFNEAKLVESIIFPDSISIINNKAFYYCSSLHSIIFNKSLTKIEERAFCKTGLKGILTIPKSCEEIGSYAFFSCDEITKIKIPAATKNIGIGAFSACYGLKSFSVSHENKRFYSDGIGLYKTAGKNREMHRLIALASGCNTKYRLKGNLIVLEQDSCCYKSIPRKGLIIPKSFGRWPGAFREAEGIVYAPLIDKEKFREEGTEKIHYIPLFVFKHAILTEEVPSIIAENPFRVLGVYCDATQREIQSNAARINRFIEIGKQISFPTDYNEILPPLKRTKEMVDRALSQISQPREKLAHALFWFTKPCCEQHKKAESLLKENKVSEAFKLLLNDCGIHKCMMAPFFSLAYNFVDIDFTILDLAQLGYDFYWNRKKYTDENDRELSFNTSLIEDICGESFVINKEDCQILFFDKLMTFVNPIHLWACANNKDFSEPILDHLFFKSIGQNIEHINAEVAIASAINKNDSNKSLQAANKLKQNTVEDISVIDEYLEPKDVRFMAVHDRLGNQLLQSAINCYNHADEVSKVVREVYSIIEYAKHIAKGEMLIKRCDDSLKTIKKDIDELPPEGLENADRELFASVTRARNSADTIAQAVALLKEAEPHLFKINFAYLTENNKDRAEHIFAYFTKVSTIIANVCLNKIIEEVNYSYRDKSSDAWNIITALNQLPLDSKFKKDRYNKNVDVLIKRISSKRYNTSLNKDSVSYELIDIRPEYEVWKDCGLKNNYNQYIKRFPKGEHINEARARQAEIEAQKEIQRKKREEIARIQREAELAEKERIEKIYHEQTILNRWIIALIELIVLQIAYIKWEWTGVVWVIVITFVLGFSYLFKITKD